MLRVEFGALMEDLAENISVRVDYPPELSKCLVELPPHCTWYDIFEITKRQLGVGFVYTAKGKAICYINNQSTALKEKASN